MHPKHSCHGRQLSRESPWDHHNQRPFVSSLLPRGLARLRANTKTRELCIHELLFADDAAIVAHTLEDIKEICKHFEQAATLFRLTISTKKTVTLHQPPPGQTSTSPHIEIYVTPLKSVNNFTYLASTVAFDNTIDMEINNRIRAASGAFGGLWKRVWSQHGIAISTKCKVYKVVVLPTLLYSAEMYTLYRRHIRKLSQVQGKIHIEEKLTQKYQHEHNRRHGLLGAFIPTVFCDDCGRGFVAQILTEEQSTRIPPFIDVIIENDGQQRRKKKGPCLWPFSPDTLLMTIVTRDPLTWIVC